jgi:hypothetical protein
LVWLSDNQTTGFNTFSKLSVADLLCNGTEERISH